MLKYKFSDCEFLVPFNNLYRGMRITMKQDNRRFRFHPDWSFLNKMKFQPLIFLSFFLSLIYFIRQRGAMHLGAGRGWEATCK